MALPINIEDLLNRRKVEGNWIEFKKRWNSIDIYHSICAFANDFDNHGGGYVLVGVEEDNRGIARRPVTGINIEEVDRILKQMVGYEGCEETVVLSDTENVTKDVTKEPTDKQEIILKIMKGDSLVTIPEMSLKTDVTIRTIKRDIKNLQSRDILFRNGGRKERE